MNRLAGIVPVREIANRLGRTPNAVRARARTVGVSLRKPLPCVCETPTPDQISASREAVQAAHGVGITAAQDWCAAQVCTQRRVWQQWERGERKMHPAFWQLAQIKKANFLRCRQGSPCHISCK